MEEPKQFCVYAVSRMEACVSKLEDNFLLQDSVHRKPVLYYRVDRNELIIDRRSIAEEAWYRARFVKFRSPDLARFLLRFNEKRSPEKVEESRKDLEISEREAKRTLYDIFKEEKRNLQETPKKPYKNRIRQYRHYLDPDCLGQQCTHIFVGHTSFASLDDALDALYKAWKDPKNDWDKPEKKKLY